uniref:Heterokaryon incompatibility domain-containing protein n=1 Tax=Moniliophthora roreri TaxID=221103 RepID=A0A0W0FRS6_MONRR
MAQTYRDANSTLVLDSGIQHCSVSAPLEEKLFSILCSGWMQCLWTLQEGLLAHRLIFAFADGFEDIDSLTPEGADLLDCLLQGLSSNVLHISIHQDSKVFRIGELARFLEWRTTSKAEDEMLAIAGLANVSAAELVNLPPHERMKIFLLRVQKLPLNIIFMSVPKLKDPGFCWAPQTLMQKGGTHMTVADRYNAVCTSTGLLTEYAAVYLPQRTVRRDMKWFLYNSTKNCIYEAAVTVPDSSDGKENTYTCDALLMMNLPQRSELVVCAAVFMIGSDSESGDRDRMICEYRQRLFLVDISEMQLDREKPKDVVEAKSGRMKTRVR